tara:strand:+ start:117 stop:1199 length:1083 start_codon:yes stop_codon:yes gene_type:complete
MKRIDLVVGARPNFIKAFPVYRALERTGKFSLRLINTGQHYDDNMAAVFFEQLKMKEPDINLGIGSGKHGEQTARILDEIEREFLSQIPDLVIVFGDVNSTLAAALAAAKLMIPVAHVEAGLRSFDRNMPEEINRVLTDQISNLLFVTSADAEDNLHKEGKDKDQIYFVGNTMIDSLVGFQSLFDSIHIQNMYGLRVKEYILVTLHRPSNVDDPVDLEKIIVALNRVADRLPCVWPVHPRTRIKLETISTKIHHKLFLTEPLGYLEFMGLQKDAAAVITDSGGIQEESTYLRVPCFTVRDNTERPVTIERGTNRLVGTDYSKIPKSITESIFKNNNFNIPELWDGKASERIANIVLNKLS